MKQANGHLNKIWRDILIEIEKSVDSIVYNTYFKESTIYKITDNNKVLVKVDNNLQKMVFMEMIELIAEKTSIVLEEQYKVEVYNKDELDTLIGNQQETNKFMTLPLEIDLSDNIQSQYNFDNFVVGDSNKESHSAALASALSPGHFYNPLFIFGNSGLGKTHLLHSIGNYAKKHKNDLKIMYITSNDFITRVVDSFKKNRIEEFKQDMYKLDILLVDDIQFLAGKEKSHEIFFYIFNELVNNKKQIVLTSDKHPTEIKGLEERLISRFYSGLSVGLDSPEFEVAKAILDKKLELQMINPDNIDDEVLSYLATHFSKDVRKLEGALNRLIFYSINFADNDRITMEVATKAFHNQTSRERDTLSVESIKDSVATYYGLTVRQIDSKNRTRIIVNARHISMYLIRKHLDISFAKIGDEIGGRDHSTVVSAYDKIQKLLKKEASYQIAINEIERKMLNQ
ncbi:MAG: chromosomal replication initiator protein DnaA [Erysipelothrix sp.]|nr:chromosomal replication initiator protein DnaA [Erysipelothrix sp.]